MDGDGLTNAEEYQIVVVDGGGSLEDFAQAASGLDPITENGGGGGCFIATAAYGTPLEAKIGTLRRFRDAYLLDTGVGAAFVDAYYRISPPIADKVSTIPVLRSAVRLLLIPVLLLVTVLLTWPIVGPLFLVTALAAIVLHRRRRHSRP